MLVYEEDERGATMLQIHKLYGRPAHQLDDAKIRALADDIRKNGVVEPLRVRPRQGESYATWTVIEGHHRLAAAERVWALSHVPCIVIQ